MARFLYAKTNVPATAALFEAVPKGENAGRGENTKGSENIISNGSKIIVPEGTALITIQDGAITGMIAEPGGFIINRMIQILNLCLLAMYFFSIMETNLGKSKIWRSTRISTISILCKLKRDSKYRFGTQSEIYWDDAYFGTQVGAVTRGTYH